MKIELVNSVLFTKMLHRFVGAFLKLFKDFILDKDKFRFELLFLSSLLFFELF